MSTFNEAHFRNWLRVAGYAPQTCTTYARDAACLLYMEDPFVGCSSARYRSLVRARELLEWYSDDEQLGIPLPEVPPKPVVDPRRARLLARKQAAQSREDAGLESIDDVEWARLWEAVTTCPKPAARVIEVMMATGLRIGDVLRISELTLASALARKDGLAEIRVKGDKFVRTTFDAARPSWSRLYAVCAEARKTRNVLTVAEAISPGLRTENVPEAGGLGAYKACERLLKVLAKQVNLSGRPNLHRLRRTVGVQTARELGTFAAQKVLGHSKGSTTDIYLDEQNVDVIREAQLALAKRRALRQDAARDDEAESAPSVPPLPR